MLIYYVDQQIQPALDTLLLRSLDFHNEYDIAPTILHTENLERLRFQWIQLYAAWQRASIFNLGPSAENGLRKSLAQELGTFPISVSKINQYLQAGDTSFQNFNRDSRGLFAIEYFLFEGSDSQALTRLNTISERSYFSALIRHFLEEVQKTNQSWKSHRNTFIQQIGTDAGSSTVQLYNAFLMAYENLKNFKLGVPLGLRMGQNQQEPEKVEALYSGQGLYGLQLQLQAIQEVWKGNQSLGFKNYLLHSTGGKELVQLTEKQLETIQEKLLGCPAGPMHLSIQSHTQAFIGLHTELQRNTRYFKSDMSSILGLTITYSSGDGD
jgi:predicted lipoprotein